jgi:putative transposase
MPTGLKRYYGTGGLHFITCSCYRREPVLGIPARRDLLLTVLEQVRNRYRFVVIGYVVMPEHIHLLISEPQIGNPSTVMQALKLGFARRLLYIWVPHFSRPVREVGDGREEQSRSPNHIWQRRFYDFNVWSHHKEIEKLRYMHRNPVKRGLVEKPEDWPWSSYRSYATGEPGLVRINDWSWTEEKIRLGIA